MNEWVARMPAAAVTVGTAPDAESESIEREFADRLRESAALAVRVAYSVLRNHQDAEDAAQEAFARAHRKFHQLRERDRFRAWLVRMVWRIALDRRRSDRRRIAREQVVVTPDISESGETTAIARERAARLWTAIDALPERLRLVTVLAAIEGHRVEDVAAMVGAPVGTVKFRLSDARKRLQEALQCLTR
jgi:RNA polymerase sigma-70 factor (ECF subfamily)